MKSATVEIDGTSGKDPGTLENQTPGKQISKPILNNVMKSWKGPHMSHMLPDLVDPGGRWHPTAAPRF